MEKKNISALLALIFLFVSPTVAVDVLVPAFHKVKQAFAISAETVLLANSSYIFGLSIGSILFGLKGAKMGPYRVLLFNGIAFVFISSTMYFLNFGFNIFVGMRFFQGFFASASVVIIPALIVSAFEKEQAHRGLNFLNGAVTGICVLMPLLATLIISILSWKFVFLLLSAIHLLALMLLAKNHDFFASQPKIDSSSSFKWRQFWSFEHNYLIVLAVLCYVCYVSFNSYIPIIFPAYTNQVLVGYQMALALSYFCGSFANAYLIGLMSSEGCFILGRNVLAASLATCAVGLYLGSPLIVMIAFSATYFSLAFVMTYMVALRLQRFKAISSLSYGVGLVLRYAAAALFIEFLRTFSSQASLALTLPILFILIAAYIAMSPRFLTKRGI